MTETRQHETGTRPMPAGRAHAGAGSRDLEQDRVSFYLTGRRMDTRLGDVDGLGLRSVQFAPYARLHELRYDYPLVLVDGPDLHTTVRSLSGIVDDVLEAVADGEDAVRVRHHAMTLEREIRTRADDGVSPLSRVWDAAAAALSAATDDVELADSIARLTAARAVDGDLVGCTEQTPQLVVGHLWRLVQEQRMGLLADRIAHLRRSLQDILDAEHANTPAGLAGDRLAESLGPVFGAEMDVESLSRLLTDNRPSFSLSDSRRARVRHLLDVLTHQRFVPSDGGRSAAGATEVPYDFVYTSASAAVTAYHERFEATTELAKALVIAEMEADGRYREETHEALFEKWSVRDLETDIIEMFPEYLVRVDAETLSAQDSVVLLEALAAGIPVKVLVTVSDLLHGSSPERRLPGDGLSARLLASSALATGESFVLQCSSAALYHARERIVSGSMAHTSALLVVYNGGGQWLGEVPPYLAAAAATESRVFPSFAYDPSAGDTWADRFTLACNPQPERDWPVHRVFYEDAALQRVTMDLPFTAADLWAGDRRLTAHLALASEGGAGGTVVPFADHLASGAVGWADQLPYLLMTSDGDRLHRVLVDRPVVHASRRILEQWHRLQELGGVHNSYVERELARQRTELEGERARLLDGPGAEGLSSSPESVPTGSPDAQVSADDAPEPEAHDPYLPWIETPRCSTCNECTLVNDRMFAYNDNRQAYIADPDAGTYADLVTAAENCQVAIIHPGKPRNPAEPGLDELVKRAASFA